MNDNSFCEKFPGPNQKNSRRTGVFQTAPVTVLLLGTGQLPLNHRRQLPPSGAGQADIVHQHGWGTGNAKLHGHATALLDFFDVKICRHAPAETARINPGVSTQPLADDACSNSTEAQSRTYYVRIGAEDQARIDALAERSGLDPDYVRRALIKAVRARMQNLRDTATWHEIASAARPRLAEPKGTGAPFMKSMIRLDATLVAALQTSIDDPLNVYGVTQLLSAFGKALLHSEIEELTQKISGIEARAARPDPA